MGFRAQNRKEASASPLYPTPYFSLQAQKYAKAPQPDKKTQGSLDFFSAQQGRKRPVNNFNN